MSRISMIKDALCFALGAVGAFISAFFGGWDAALTTLMIFMIIDYATGMIVAAVFHRSEKTADGTLESRAGWKGLCRKGASLLVVLIACRLDLLMGTSFIRDTVVIGVIANETISIVREGRTQYMFKLRTNEAAYTITAQPRQIVELEFSQNFYVENAAEQRGADRLSMLVEFITN